tara:strand:- start:707 stop:898 length:192 start_codon:yes stop_codon:yes gene_type:complete
MQPWEREKTVKKTNKSERTFLQKIGLATNAIALSAVTCTLIYGSLVYECCKEVAFKIDPKLKR